MRRPKLLLALLVAISLPLVYNNCGRYLQMQGGTGTGNPIVDGPGQGAGGGPIVILPGDDGDNSKTPDSELPIIDDGEGDGGGNNGGNSTSPTPIPTPVINPGSDSGGELWSLAVSVCTYFEKCGSTEKESSVCLTKILDSQAIVAAIRPVQRFAPAHAVSENETLRTVIEQETHGKLKVDVMQLDACIKHVSKSACQPPRGPLNEFENAITHLLDADTCKGIIP